MNKTILVAAGVLFSAWASPATAQQTDQTARIKNAGFESTNNLQIKSTDNGGIWQPENWTLAYTGDESDPWDQGIISSGLDGNGLELDVTIPEGEQIYYFRSRWIVSSIYLSQELTDVPRGSYTLTCTAMSPEGSQYPGELSAHTLVKKTSVEINGEEWEEYSVDFNVLGDNENVTIGVMYEHIDAAAAGRFYVDNFRLTYNGEPDDEAIIGQLKEELSTQLAIAYDFQEPDLPKSIWRTLDNSINQAVEALRTDDVEVLNEATADLIESIELAHAGVEALLNLSIALEVGFLNLETYSDYPGNVVYTEQLTAAIDLMTSETAGISELEQAVTDLATADRTFLLSGFVFGSAERPIEASWLITNPDFEQETTGWDNPWSMNSNDNGYVGFEGRFTERWVTSASALGDFNLSQTLIDVPNGVYVVSAWIIATRQSDPDLEVVGTYLYGNAATTAASTENGVPQLFTVEVVVADQTLTLGIKTESTNANWVAVDNFSLAYIGQDATTLKELVEKEIVTVEELLISGSERIMGVESAAANAAIAQGRAAESTAELTEAYVALTTALENMHISIANYEALTPILNEALDLTESDEYPEEAMDQFKASLDQNIALLTDPATSGTDLPQIGETVTEDIRVLRISKMNLGTENDPADATFLIINPGFDENTINGWTSEEAPTAVNHTEVEFFQKAFDFYQEINNIPNGVYDLTVQGFQRVAANDSAQAYEAGTEVITAQLYANNDSVAMRSLYSESPDDMKEVSGTSKGYPNDMTGAQEAFNLGLYKSETLTVSVSSQKLVIGIRNYRSETNGWVCFDNFVLSYRGNEEGLGVSNVNSGSSSIIAYAENGYIKVVNATEFTVTTLTGVSVDADRQLAPGIYIVSANGNATKVRVQ